jgi:hypothetical protein
MNGNSGDSHELEQVLEEDPQSKHGDEGEAVHHGDQAGPNSSRAGQPIAPQTGDPRARDRRPD